MKTYQEFCEPRTKEIGAPVEIVSPKMTKWANEYGDYANNDGKEQVAAIMYQALGSIESSAMPDGEWKRCMDWLSATANGADAGELLPVYSLEGVSGE